MTNLHLTEFVSVMVTAAIIWAWTDVRDANSTEIDVESVMAATIAENRFIVPNHRK